MAALRSKRGTPAERKVAQLGRALGYLVSSRRHEAGPGDQLWLPPVRPGMRLSWDVQPLLIEVKNTTDPPWRSTWGNQERIELIAWAERWGCEPILAWLPPGLGGIVWLPPEDWPRIRLSEGTHPALASAAPIP